MEKTPNFLDMTDEEISRLSEPPEVEDLEDMEDQDTDQEDDQNPPQEDDSVDSTDSEEEKDSDVQEEDESDSEADETPSDEDSSDEREDETLVADDTGAAKGNDKFPGEDEKGEEVAPNEPDYKAFYKKVMAPFKANGKMITLSSPEEVIRLMQMGANYHKKMQALQPYRKILMMLEDNDLLNEERLSFLIDIDKGDKEAIKKLLRDAKIDPIDIDISEEPKYTPGKHVVTDQRARLVSIIEDIRALPGGSDTLQTIHSTWDKASKDILFQNPEILGAIHKQMQDGAYERIAAEVEKAQTLGEIPASVPFLAAYKMVGDIMLAQGALRDLGPEYAPPQAPQTPLTRAPIDTRVKKPRKTVSDNQRAKAAAPPRNAPKPVKEEINFLALDDDEFMRRFEKKLSGML